MRIQLNKLAREEGAHYRSGEIYYKDDYSYGFKRRMGYQDRDFIMACYCRRCRTEYYARWFLSGEFERDIFNANMSEPEGLYEEYDRIIFELSKCPKCGDKLIKSGTNPTSTFSALTKYCTKDEWDSFYYYEDYVHVMIMNDNWMFSYDREEFSLERIYDSLREMEVVLEEKEAEKKAEMKFTRKKKKWESMVSNRGSEKVKTISSPDTLKEYILQLIQLETNIYALSERLPQLYAKEQITTRQVSRELYSIKEGIKSDIETYRRELDDAPKRINERIQGLEQVIQAEEKNIADYQNKKASVRDSVDPIKLDLPAEPIPPVLKKPGFFNKAKVLAENGALMAAFEEARRNHHLEVERIKQEEARLSEEQYMEMEHSFTDKIATSKANLNATKLELELAQKDKREYEMQHLGHLKKKIQLLEQKLSNADNPSASDTNAPSIFLQNSIHKEIQVAEELLQKTYEARNTLYSYNIIFGKYRNIVAISTFYEYLLSGRCTSLEGASGAYNLYESEIRADMIISQLSTVVEKLEDIKQGQYMLYSQLREANSMLSTLNDKMERAAKSLSHIEHSAAAIENSAEQIAYNTEVSAYYAKKNAELTNALGFMVALK